MSQQLHLPSADGDLRCVLHGSGERRVAVVLPGRGYTPARPLLHTLRRVTTNAGWSVLEVWWDHDPAGWSDEDAMRDALLADLTTVLDAPVVARAAHRLFVGKSLGTVALAVAEDRLDPVAASPALWLTPYTSLPWVHAALLGRRAPTLVIAGTEDPASPLASLVELQRSTHHRVHLVPGADHELEVADPFASLDDLRTTAEVAGDFVSNLRASRERKEPR